MIYDLGANVLPVRVTTTASKTATVTGTTVDTQGFNSLMFLIVVDAVSSLTSSNYWTFTDGCGANSGGSDASSTNVTYGYATINSTAGEANSVAWASPYYIGNGNNTANRTYAIGIQLFDSINTTVSSNRYHTPVLTITGSASATLGITALLGGPVHGPALEPATV